jgi:hypothetical protein
MITRIPQVTPEFHDPQIDPLYDNLQIAYFLEDSNPEWRNLHVARFVSRNIIRTAIQIHIGLASEHWYANRFELFINVTAEVLREAISLSGEQPSKDWFIIKSSANT